MLLSMLYSMAVGDDEDYQKNPNVVRKPHADAIDKHRNRSHVCNRCVAIINKLEDTVDGCIHIGWINLRQYDIKTIYGPGIACSCR
jgi:hypothetical protein